MSPLLEPVTSLSPPHPAPAESVEPSSSPCCEFCGRAEAHVIAGHSICDGCYIAKGSCCAGDE